MGILSLKNFGESRASNHGVAQAQGPAVVRMMTCDISIDTESRFCQKWMANTLAMPSLFPKSARQMAKRPDGWATGIAISITVEVDVEMDNDEFRQQSGSSDNANRKGQRNRKSRSSSKRWLISPLWIVIISEALIIGGLVVWGALLEQENAAFSEKEKALAQTITDRKAELEGLRWEFNALKIQQEKSCLSNLTPLKFDEVMNIDKEYVKSVMFMLSGKQERKVLEYKLVLKNAKHIDVIPHLDIVFFNAFGKQIGVVKIGYIQQGVPTGKVLEKGEVRSVDGTFELADGVPPGFMAIKFKDENE